MSEAPVVSAISHVTLTVTNAEASAAWYERALRMSRLRVMTGPSWTRILMVGDGVMIGLQQHDATSAKDRFDERRVGIDHLSIACADRGEIERWIAHLDAQGIAHSPISEPPAHVATVRDPDGISLEFFARG